MIPSRQRKCAGRMDSSSSMVATAFVNERELQSTLARLDLILPTKHRNVIYKREVPVGSHIPDFIYVCFDNEPDPSLWPARLTYRHAFVIWLLRQNPLDSVALAARFHEPIERVEPILFDLQKCGAIELCDSNRLRLSAGMAAVGADVVAVEAKLSKWRAALHQAISYLRFSDSAFVAMDATRIRVSTMMLRQFEDSGVGLCATQRDRVEWLVEPKRQFDVSSPDREYLIASSITVGRQQLWSRRYPSNAVSHA